MAGPTPGAGVATALPLPRAGAVRPKTTPSAVRWASIMAVVAAGLFVPMLVTSTFYLGVLINVIILGVAAIGLGFLMHQCGLVMFGVAGFVGTPAYLFGIALMNFGWSTTAAVCFALVGTTLFAVCVGAMVVRARPLPFAMLTLALAQMLRSIATLQVMRPITAGDDGLAMTLNGTFLGLTQSELGRPASFWPVAWIALCLVMLLAWAAGRSRLGQVLRATKANEERMRFSGFNTYLPRLAAFTLACFIIAVSGVLIGLNTAFASPELLDFASGGNALVAMLVGGASTVSGPLLGALLYIWGQDAFGATGHLELLTGIAVVVVMVAFPQGAMGFLRSIAGKAIAAVRGPRKGGGDAAR